VAGLERFNVSSWFALLGPAGMSSPQVERLNAEVQKLLRSPAVAERLLKAGMDPTPSAPSALSERISADLDKWRKVAARLSKS
jgi:tripartite-type tricarboxylate transporter receptor subunit TctC